jgi:hypothetical protein
VFRPLGIDSISYFVAMGGGLPVFCCFGDDEHVDVEQVFTVIWPGLILLALRQDF